MVQGMDVVFKICMRWVCRGLRHPIFIDVWVQHGAGGLQAPPGQIPQGCGATRKPYTPFCNCHVAAARVLGSAGAVCWVALVVFWLQCTHTGLWASHVKLQQLARCERRAPTARACGGLGLGRLHNFFCFLFLCSQVHSLTEALQHLCTVYGTQPAPFGVECSPSCAANLKG